MGAFVALVAGIGVASAWCAVVLIRRGRRGPTENADGLLIEQAARIRARQLRSEGRGFGSHQYPKPRSGSDRRPY
ncbi:hypothetical protein [Streptomyces sp. SID8016]|uniref:hypothetical protein n=1 Tax=Streptomyces sp. SID8016 TaxID=2706098 RepID=UPI0013D981F5|nr:hypothetical protein [Streptomyces sp. SID8016]